LGKPLSEKNRREALSGDQGGKIEGEATAGLQQHGSNNKAKLLPLCYLFVTSLLPLCYLIALTDEKKVYVDFT